MIVLDTDILTLLLHGHKRVTGRRAQTSDEVAITVATRIEILQGRFASVLKAENGEKLLLAQRRLVENEKDLEQFTILAIDGLVAAEFDRLRHRGLKNIRRGDLLIACIALANKATLVTRNQRDFRQVPGLKLDNWAD